MLLDRAGCYYDSQTNKLFQEYAGTHCSAVNTWRTENKFINVCTYTRPCNEGYLCVNGAYVWSKWRKSSNDGYTIALYLFTRSTELFCMDVQYFSKFGAESWLCVARGMRFLCLTQKTCTQCIQFVRQNMTTTCSSLHGFDEGFADLQINSWMLRSSMEVGETFFERFHWNIDQTGRIYFLFPFFGSMKNTGSAFCFSYTCLFFK